MNLYIFLFLLLKSNYYLKEVYIIYIALETLLIIINIRLSDLINKNKLYN